MAPYVADDRYSPLHQERTYLLSALAKEESRAEHLCRCLETITTKLKTAEGHEDSTDTVKNLRMSAAAITRKLKKCHESERAMANNLATLTTLMQMLGQHQWRKAQFEYSKRMQQTLTDGMTLGLQDMSLVSPITPAYGYPYTPFPSASSMMSPLSLTGSPLPATPAVQPQMALACMEYGWDTPMPTPYQNNFQMAFGTNTSFNPRQLGMAYSGQAVGIQPSSRAAYDEPLNPVRRMSLPNPPRTSWQEPGGLTGIGEDLAMTESIELERRSGFD